MQEHRIDEQDTGMRLDRWFKREYPEVTHSLLNKWLRKGQVRVDGKKAEGKTRLAEGQCITIKASGVGSPLVGEQTRKERSDAERRGGAVLVKPPPTASASVRDAHLASATPPQRVSRFIGAATLTQHILYEDKHLIAINKPAGLAVQGGTKVRESVDHWLDALASETGERPRLVHRLDKDTSGVLLIAKHARAARELTAAFRAKETQKTYWALVAGVPEVREGTIDLPLAKGREAGEGREKMGITPDGKRALTAYRVLDTLSDRVAWLELQPITGRTHQLRVHCMAIGHPILGDGKYGGRAAFPEGITIPKQLHLHSREIHIPGVAGGVSVTAPLKPPLKDTWQALGFFSG